MPEVTARDMAILGGFTAVLALGSVLYYRHTQAALGPDDGAAPEARTATARRERGAADPDRPVEPEGLLVSSLAPGAIPPEYQVLVQRKLFEPLVRPNTGQRGVGGVTPNLPAMPRVDLVPRPVKPTEPARQPDPPGGSHDPFSPRTPPAVPEAPKPNLALTGLMMVGEQPKVLIEETQFKLSRFVGVGDEVFGWVVVAVSVPERTVSVRPAEEGPAKAVVLRLGEGKPVEQPKAPAAAAPTPPPTGSGGTNGNGNSEGRPSMGPSGMDAARIEAYRRGYRGGSSERRGDYNRN